MKTNTTVSVDTLALQSCKSRGFNVSKICSDALILYSNQSIDGNKNLVITKLEDAKKDLDTLIDAQKIVQNGIEQKKIDALNEFIEKVNDNVILEGHEAQLLYWSKQTGLIPEDLKAQKIARAYQKQKESLEGKQEVI